MLALQFVLRTCSTVTQFERLTIVFNDVTNASVWAGWKLLDEQLHNGLVSDLAEQYSILQERTLKKLQLKPEDVSKVPRLSLPSSSCKASGISHT